MNQFGLHKRVVDVSRREKNDSERDEDILVGVVEGIGTISACQRGIDEKTCLDKNSMYSATFSKRYSGSILKSSGDSAGRGSLR